MEYILDNNDNRYNDKYKIAFYCAYGFLFILLVVASILSSFEIWPFEPYKRSYAPPGIGPAQNVSPYISK